METAHILFQDRALCRVKGLSKAAHGPLATELAEGQVWCPDCLAGLEVVHYGTNDGTVPACRAWAWEREGRHLVVGGPVAQRLTPGRKWCVDCQKVLRHVAELPRIFPNPGEFPPV